MKKFHVKKNDNVVVLAGKSKGESGIIKKVIRKKNKVIVENINMYKKAIKPTEENPSGGFIDIEMPIHISNVMLKEQYDKKKTTKND